MVNQKKTAAAISALLALVLTGCATCREHPKTCSVVSILAVGSIAASLHQDSNSRPHDVALSDPSLPACTIQPNGSCR